jgi:hypothetical protein
MKAHKALIDKFYLAFKVKDYRTMQNAYHNEAQFSDPVFENLSSDEVRAMWQMLISGGKDLQIMHKNATADDIRGQCHWEAWYTFTGTGRKVHNIIHASFEFKDGLIYRHRDHFSFWRWSRQALGGTGLLLGWTPVMHDKVKDTARKRLDAFIAKNKEKES